LLFLLEPEQTGDADADQPDKPEQTGDADADQPDKPEQTDDADAEQTGDADADQTDKPEQTDDADPYDLEKFSIDFEAIMKMTIEALPVANWLQAQVFNDESTIYRERFGRRIVGPTYRFGRRI
jgi:hypothetical protein